MGFVGGVDGRVVQGGHDFLVLDVGFDIGVVGVLSFLGFGGDFLALVIDEDGVFVDVSWDL